MAIKILIIGLNDVDDDDDENNNRKKKNKT